MRGRNGFTLIELLVVITIIGILASIALPRYAYLKQKAYLTAVTSDLRNLVTAQEAFNATWGDYAGGIAAGGVDVGGTSGSGQVAFAFSPDVELVRLRYRFNRNRGAGWNAVVRHRLIRDRSTDRCGVFMGHTNYSPNRAVTEAGVVACW
jgi:prepilin-type N-terminal cleavage/methylation domain-containing protein